MERSWIRNYVMPRVDDELAFVLRYAKERFCDGTALYADELTGAASPPVLFAPAVPLQFGS